MPYSILRTKRICLEASTTQLSTSSEISALKAATTMRSMKIRAPSVIASIRRRTRWPSCKSSSIYEASWQGQSEVVMHVEIETID